MREPLIDPIIVKRVKFEHCSNTSLYLNPGDIITPVWKRGKLVLLLITDRKTGNAFYVNTYTNEIYIESRVSVVYLPQGATIFPHEKTKVDIFHTWITFYPIK